MRRPLPRPLLVLATLCAPLGCRGHGPQPADAGAPPAAALQPAFDPAAIGPGAPPKLGPARPLDVLDHGPIGRSEGGGGIHLRFNQPVVALELTTGALGDLFTIDPPLPGRAYWKSPDLLAFDPDGAPAPCRTYKVRFNGGVVGLDGQRFDRPIEWTFETPRPLVVGSFPASRTAGDDGAEPEGDAGERGDQRRDTTVFIEFDRAVGLREVQAHVRAGARALGRPAKAAGTDVPVRVRLATAKEVQEHFYYYDRDVQRRVYAVQPRGLWPLGSAIEVSVTPGLVSEDGPLPLDTPWAMTFRTHGPQKIDAMNCAPEAPCGLEPLTLKLHNPVEEAQLRKISVTPKPRYLEISSVDDWGEGGQQIVIEGQFVPDTTYTVRLAPDLKDIYGQTLPGGLSRTAVIAPRATLALSAGTGTLATGKPQDIGVESRHVQAVHVRVGVYTDAELQTVPFEPEDPAKLAFPAKVIERTIPLTPSGKADWSDLVLDLKDLSGNARGAVLVEVRAAELVARARQYGAPPPVRGLFRLTDLGPVALVSLPASSVQVLRLSSGTAVPGARISREDPKAPGKRIELGVTDKDGLLALPAELVLPQPPAAPVPADPSAPPLRLTVRDPQTDDRAYLDLTHPYYGQQAVEIDDKRLRPGERLLAQLVSERGVYRPGELVRVVGWSALDTPFSRSNLGRLKPGTKVRFELQDPFQKVVATHTTKVGAEGKFWAELQVPAGAALGRFTVVAELAGDKRTVGVKVEDYRVPEYTVEARARRPDILAGESSPIDVHASYYFGGPVPIKRLTRQTRCDRQAYRPPGLEGRWQVGEPLARDRHSRTDSGRIVEADPAAPTAGRREFQDPGTARETRFPYRCTTSVEVQDVSLQGIGAETGFLIHPAAFYLALARPTSVLEAGTTGTRVPLRAVDIQGQRVAVAGARLAITRHFSERSYKPEGGKQVFDKWVERSVPVVTCKLDVPASGPEPECDLPALVEGRYDLAVEADEPGSPRIARTRMSFHVRPKRRHGDSDWRSRPIARLEVLTERTAVRPGETLEVAVRAPWPGARGTLVLAREGLRETLPVALTDGQALFKFTADDTWTPNLTFIANIVDPNNGHPRLHRSSAQVKQDPEHRRLDVVVEAPTKVGPGDPVDLRVRVRDDQNQPIAARVALWAVDEAVLDLTNYEVPDLLPTFVVDRPIELSVRDDYSTILYPHVAEGEDPWFATITGSRGGSGSGYGSGSGSGSMGGRSASGPTVAQPARSRFETTPVFLADLAVDKTGEARVKARMPENLGTFRVTAIASARLVDGSGVGRFGKNDARTVVTAPLVLRAAMPRQLRPGDRAEVAAIVQNNTGAAGRVQVTVHVPEATGPNAHVLKVISLASASAELADGGQARLVFQVAAEGPGQPELELQAALTPSAGGPPIRDGLRLPLPITPERTLTERVAAYGTVTDDQAIAIPIKIPRDVLAGHGGITIDTSSTLLGGLEDAVHELVHYPYGCVEQTSSGLLPLVALGPLAKDYPLGIPDPKEFVRAGVERILSMQTASGGFGYWPGDDDVHVYASAYATWVLQLAASAGYPVPEEARKRALDDLETRITGTKLAQIPVDWGYHDGVRVAIALHTLSEAGRDVRKASAELFTLRQQLPQYARAFLLMALHRQDPADPNVRVLLGELLGNIQELPGTAHTHEPWLYSNDAFFASDGRSDAIVLMALLRVDPNHALVTKLARGLLERRVGGSWRNTQENAYALVALTDFARVHEAELPDLRARAWVGPANVLDVAFKGRELLTRTATTPMAKILGLSQGTGDGSLPVILQRSGQGRLYYRLGAEWAPSAQAELPARSQGLTVTRTLRTAAGTASAEVPAGEPIAMDLTIRSDTRVRYVVIDVPLPAGLEGVSRTLGRGRGAAVLSGHRGWWVSHEEQRPDRVVVFADDLSPGTHSHTIDLRSTSRGQFTFPPATAEAMYMPEVHGRTAGAALDVR